MIRITRFDSDKADELIAKLEDEMAQVKHHLANLIDFAIDYFSKLKEKYGKGRSAKPKSEISTPLKRRKWFCETRNYT